MKILKCCDRGSMAMPSQTLKAARNQKLHSKRYLIYNLHSWICLHPLSSTYYMQQKDWSIRSGEDPRRFWERGRYIIRGRLGSGGAMAIGRSFSGWWTRTKDCWMSWVNVENRCHCFRRKYGERVSVAENLPQYGGGYEVLFALLAFITLRVYLLHL